VNVKDLATTHYDLDHFGDMLDKMFRGRDNIKIIVHPTQD
jgi:hypothetical protein